MRNLFDPKTSLRTADPFAADFAFRCESFDPETETRGHKPGVGNGIFEAIRDAAGQGEDVLKHVVNQVLGSAAINPLGIGAGGPQSAFNRLSHGQLFGEPHGAPAQAPMPGVSYGPGKLMGLLGAALANGKTIAGTQPYTVTSYFGIASASAVAKNTDIADMFASANCTAFKSDDTFPWPFQSYRMRWSYSSGCGLNTVSAVGTLAQVSDPAWVATLHAVFSNATEIARVALNNLGLRTSFMGFANTAVVTQVGSFAMEIDTQPGVLWPVYYEKTGSYQMSVRSDHVATTVVPFQLSMQLDGWVINDPTLIDANESQIQNTLDGLLKNYGFGGSNSVSVSPR